MTTATIALSTQREPELLGQTVVVIGDAGPPPCIPASVRGLSCVRPSRGHAGVLPIDSFALPKRGPPDGTGRCSAIKLTRGALDACSAVCGA
jgi:hypothetical protein